MRRSRWDSQLKRRGCRILPLLMLAYLCQALDKVGLVRRCVVRLRVDMLRRVSLELHRKLHHVDVLVTDTTSRIMGWQQDVGATGQVSSQSSCRVTAE